MNEDRRASFVLVVEDHPLVADSLVSCVHECDGMLKVFTAESLRAALRILKRRPEPVLITADLTLTDAKGMQSVRSLREAAPASPLLVFTALDDPALRGEAMRLGVMGYIIKSASVQTLRDEVRRLIGDRPRSNLAAPALPDDLNQLLTPRQRAVLEELAAGRSNRQIAGRMSISEETVSSHMKEILGRLGVRNRTEAVIRYLQAIASPPNRLLDR